MSEKNQKNETIKKAKKPDAEYSGNLTPSNNRLKEAGYGKSMDLELADIGQSQAKNEAEIYNPGRNTENTAKMRPETNIIQPDDAKTNRDFEFGNMETQNNAVNLLEDADITGLNTEFAGELTHDLKETGDRNFEFGDLDKKAKSPSEKWENHKFKINPNHWSE